jgi:hypothetical protein
MMIRMAEIVDALAVAYTVNDWWHDASNRLELHANFFNSGLFKVSVTGSSLLRAIERLCQLHIQ